jgi:quinol monooxygenase YgiN
MCVGWAQMVTGVAARARADILPCGACWLEWRKLAASFTFEREGTMYARVTSLGGSPADVDAGVANFRENVVPFTREQGGKGAILLVDRESGSAVAITLWEDEAAMSASEERANALRAQAAEEMGTSEQPSVARYEVAVFET